MMASRRRLVLHSEINFNFNCLFSNGALAQFAIRMMPTQLLSHRIRET
jgi:hypothetical protein